MTMPLQGDPLLVVRQTLEASLSRDRRSQPPTPTVSPAPLCPRPRPCRRPCGGGDGGVGLGGRSSHDGVSPPSPRQPLEAVLKPRAHTNTQPFAFRLQPEPCPTRRALLYGASISGSRALPSGCTTAQTRYGSTRPGCRAGCGRWMDGRICLPVRARTRQRLSAVLARPSASARGGVQQDCRPFQPSGCKSLGGRGTRRQRRRKRMMSRESNNQFRCTRATREGLRMLGGRRIDKPSSSPPPLGTVPFGW